MRTPPALPKHQHGALLILLVIALGILAATVFVGMLSSSDIQNQRDKTTAAALAEAKAALIGYAASDLNRPGELPCPDYNGDGQVTVVGDYNGSNCKTYIGRLPWKSLGLKELQDGYGELLWYTLSSNFQANGSAPLNSNVAGQLSVTGISPASNVVAIIFSPGQALAGQSRTQLVTTTPPNVQDYLDGSNKDGDNQFEIQDPSTIFNDKLILITHHELFTVIERRITNTIIGTGPTPSSGLRHYFQIHTFYPPSPLDYASLDLNLSPSTQNMISDNGWDTQVTYSLPRPMIAKLAFPDYCTASIASGQLGITVCH